MEDSDERQLLQGTACINESLDEQSCDKSRPMSSSTCSREIMVSYEYEPHHNATENENIQQQKVG